MLVGAGVLIIMVAAMHSLLGGKRLIGPLLRQSEFPIILGSDERSRLTLFVGWHMLSATWLVLAGLLFAMHFVPTTRSDLLIGGCAVLFAICGLTALCLSRGRHLSWVFFLPTAFLLFFDILRS